MITGAHTIIYSRDADADRAFIKDVLALPSVDVGGGWLIFGLPPAELAFHPDDTNDRHEFYLMCDDVEKTVAALKSKGVTCGPVSYQGWGLLTEITLPGGGKLGMYEPRHARPKSATVKASRRKPAAKKASKKTPAKRKGRRRV